MTRDHIENAEHTRRRRFLRAIGALSVVGLAGCSGDGDGTATDTGTDVTETDENGTETDGNGTDAPTDPGGDTPTETPTDPGGDTPTETPTETEPPEQPIPEDPPTVVSFGDGGTVPAGGTATLTATVANPFLFPIQSVEVSLDAPNADWTVEATGETALGTIDTAGSAEVSWEVTAPEDEIGSATISGTLSYATNTDSRETELSQSLIVFEPGEVPGDGLEAYYPLDGDTATNQTTGTDATVVGDPTAGASGIVGDAFEFTTNGSTESTADALVSGGDLPVNGEGATVAAWVRYTDRENAGRLFQVGGGPDEQPDDGWNVEFNFGSNNIKLVTWNGGNAASSDLVTLSQETWYLVVGVVDGGDGTLYVFDESGELSDSPVTTNSRGQTGEDVLIMMAGDARETAGRIDEVRAYSRALSAGEVTALYEGSLSGE